MNTALTSATNLRALMAERGLSPEELAQSCAMNLTTVQAARFCLRRNVGW